MDNSNSKVHINTNGGMRTPAWWEDLGNYCGKRLIVHFDIDGINNEMHQKYRRGVDLQTALDNMEALSSTDASAKAFIILFKHNQDYVEEIKKMCIMYGADETYIIKSDRFLVNDTYDFINEKGEKDSLKEADSRINHYVQNAWIDTAAKNQMKAIGKTDKTIKTKMLSANDR